MEVGQRVHELVLGWGSRTKRRPAVSVAVVTMFKTSAYTGQTRKAERTRCDTSREDRYVCGHCVWEPRLALFARVYASRLMDITGSQIASLQHLFHLTIVLPKFQRAINAI